MGEEANQEGARTVKEQAILTLDIDELKMIVRDAIAEALENFGGLDNQDNKDTQNEIMSRSDIAKYLGINPKNVMSGSPLAYYVPFDKRNYKAEGVKEISEILDKIEVKY